MKIDKALRCPTQKTFLSHNKLSLNKVDSTFTSNYSPLLCKVPHNQLEEM